MKTLPGSPCLSFDVIADNLGLSRDTFPHTCYIVSGTQANKKNLNNIIVMKVMFRVALFLLTFKLWNVRILYSF